ncbi:MAG: molybdenum ABC transporter ATP-binding protein, partial [Gammaproteobacteria bacterium]|nr:molybdenum ABC transporter ATP-binding protein [Gammaproteobacteria bacterium]
FQGGNLWIPASNKEIGFKTRLVILARDISIALSNHTDTSILNRVQAVITKIQEDTNPAFLQIHSKAGPNNFRALVTKKSFNTLELERGKSIWLQIKSVAIST